MSRSALLLVLSGSLLAVTGGCDQKKGSGESSKTPSIPVSKPVQQMVTEYVEFTGRTDAVQSVDIRARVTGYLRGDNKARALSGLAGQLASPLGETPLLTAASLYPGQHLMPFREGSEVREGDLLFEIDPRPYQAQYLQALRQVELNDASLRLAKKTLDISLDIVAKVPNGVSSQVLAQQQAAVDEAEARVEAFKASADLYKLNLSYTRVTSPIDGQVSRYYLTSGNTVTQDQTLLTTIVSLDPMYAYFDMDDATLLRIRRAVQNPDPLLRIQPLENGKTAIQLGLPDQEDYPNRGVVDFVNNQLNPTTGSISVRGRFDNPKINDVRLMSPGMFVKIRLPIGHPRPELLVIDRVIQSDQGNKYVYVVDKNDEVQYRRVTTGVLLKDGLRVIKQSEKPDEGVKEGEWIVTGTLQQVQQIRPKTKVKKEERAMPRNRSDAIDDANK